MNPTSFPQQNLIYGRPESMTDEECGPLPVHRNRDQNVSISCWKLSEEEKQTIMETGVIWVWHHGNFLQPLSVEARNPFLQ